MNRTITLNATGESVTFVETTEETNGEYLEIIVTLKAGGEGPPPHIHNRQTEIFEVLEGTVGVLHGGDKSELKPGDVATIGAGVLHNFWCAGNEDITFRARIEPALNFEWMLREVFASCNRRNKKDPSPWDGSYILTKINGEYTMGGIPKFVQKGVFPVMGGVGKLLGLVKVRPMKEKSKNVEAKLA